MRYSLLFFLLTSLVLPSRSWPVNIKETTAERNQKPPGPFLVPTGTVNLALGKPVTSSDDAPIVGESGFITDGEKEGKEGNWVELGPGVQWVQIDLLAQSQIFGVHIWHYYGFPRVYRDVVVQISNDPEFKTGVRTIYNNDQNNSSGLGKGSDKEFYELHYGFRIDTRGKNYEGMSGRYVRLYSNGNTGDTQNQYIEVEVIGKPLSAAPKPSVKVTAKGKHAIKTPAGRPDLMLWKTKIPPPPYL